MSLAPAFALSPPALSFTSSQCWVSELAALVVDAAVEPDDTGVDEDVAELSELPPHPAITSTATMATTNRMTSYLPGKRSPRPPVASCTSVGARPTMTARRSRHQTDIWMGLEGQRRRWETTHVRVPPLWSP